MPPAPPCAARHLLGRCDECDARTIAAAPLERVDSWYRQGLISQDAFEAFMHCWATGAPRFGSLADGWREPPTDPRTSALVELIRAAA